MQETRRQILTILRDQGECTVDEVVQMLEKVRGSSITSVTVRHHLNKLQNDGLVDTPQLLHRSSPGRPQHVYVLTQQGHSHLPNNYQQMTEKLLKQIQQHLPENQINVIIEGIATDMAHESQIDADEIQARLDQTVTYLNNHGYDAEWKKHPDGYVLHTYNCPYHHVAKDDEMLCQVDLRLMSKMIGIVPRMISNITEGGSNCAYLIPVKSN